MASLLPILVLLLLVLAGAAWLRAWRAGALAGGVVWGGLVWLFTEGGSLLGFYTPAGMMLAWGAASAVVLGVCARTLRAGGLPAPHLAGAGWFGGAAVFGVVVILGVTCALGLAYAPTNFDALTYHLSRVAHWAQNGSVAFYPTSIDRQNFLEPFAEYVIAQFYMLAGGDRLAFGAQWLAFFGCILGASYVAELLGGKPRAQVWAAVFAASLPMGILQASGAQNDLVASFWLVCVAVFALRLMKPGAGKPADALLFAISLGLALLTKATLRMYALPFVVWVAVWMLRRARLSAIPKLAGIACVVILINAPFVSRNYSLFGAALMPPARVGNFTNAVVTPGVVVSNVLRNVALHFGVPRADLNRQFIAQPVIAIHQALGLDASDPRATYDGTRFAVSDVANFEDTSGNPLHVALAAAALGALALRRKLRQNKLALALAFIGVADFILFCAVLRWQPWHSRLHLPLFMLFAPLVALVWDEAAPGWAVALACAALLAAAYFPLARNFTRPLNQMMAQLKAPRQNGYFHDTDTRRYQTAMNRVYASPCRVVGLALNGNTPEYLFWAARPVAQPPAQFWHVFTAYESAPLKNPSAPPCAVIAQGSSKNQLELNGQVFVAQWQSGDLALFAPSP